MSQRKYEYQGQCKTLDEWCKKLSLDRGTMHWLLYDPPFTTFPEAIEMHNSIMKMRQKKKMNLTHLNKIDNDYYVMCPTCYIKHGHTRGQWYTREGNSYK